MRKILLLLLVLSYYPISSYAKNDPKVDAITASGANESEKIKKLNALAAQYIENNQLTEAEEVAYKALELLKKAKNEQGLAATNLILGQVAQLHFDYTNAMNYFVSALKIYDGLGYKVGIATAKNHIGKVFFLQRNDENALAQFTSAFKILTETKGDKNILAEVHRNLGDLFLSQKLYGKATAEFDTALRIWSEETQDLKKAAGLASYLGTVVADIGHQDAALTYFNASLNFHRNLNDANGVARDLINLAEIYLTMGDSEMAMENILSAQSAFEVSNDKYGMAESLCMLGKAYLKLNNRSQAESNFEKSAEILRGVPFQPIVPKIYKSIAEGFSEMGNFPKAYNFASAYATSKDSLYNKEKATALLELTTKFESELSVKDKNRQLANLEKEKATEERVRWMLLGLVGIGLIAIYFIYKSYSQKKKDNQKLHLMNQTIQQQNNEIARKNVEMNVANQELQEKNQKLDYLNERLVQEISERENSEKSLFSKDHFLANITSRMRQPLNDVVGLAQALISDNPRKDQRDHLQNLQFAANNLLVLINDVLDFSKIEAGKLQFEPVEFKTEDVIVEVNREIKSTPDVTFEYHVDQRIPKDLIGDPVRVTQIISYLLKNLKKQVTKGTISTHVLKSEIIDNELTIKLDIVADNCNALTFERFDSILTTKESDNIEHQEDGDFEIVVARRLVELQNGTISINKKDAGVALQIFLPFKLADAEAAEQKTENVMAIVAQANFLEGKRVLVVEDNKVNQMLVANMLKKKGIVVSTANDGLDGLDAVKKGDYDLILMDIQMPRMDGYRAVAEIRKMTDNRKANLPIIALTASAYVNEKEKAQLFGMTDHIGKPFSPEELLDKITRVLMSQQNDNGQLEPVKANV